MSARLVSRLDALAADWAGRFAGDPQRVREVRSHALVYVAVCATSFVVCIGCVFLGNFPVAIGGGLVAVVHGAMLGVIRAGRPRVAGVIGHLTIIAATQASVIETSRIELAPMVLATVLVVAALTATIRWTMVVAALVLASVISWYPLLSGATQPRSYDDLVTLALLLLLVITSATIVGSWNRTRDSAQIAASAGRAEALAAHLKVVNEGLENRVEQRTAELHRAVSEQAELVRKLDELAQRDELTGLHNRRRLMAAMLRPEVRLHPHCLLIADLDHFKRINDTYGHVVGDTALRAVGMALSAQARTGEVVARIGGEEFAVLLPDTDVAEAAHTAERLRAAVAGLSLPQLGGRQLTLSIGVSACEGRFCPQHASDEEHRALLMHRADLALYQAKALGRNRIEIDR